MKDAILKTKCTKTKKDRAMFRRITVLSLIFGFWSLAVISTSYAVTTEELLKKIEKMERRIRELESKLIRRKKGFLPEEKEKVEKELTYIERFLKDVEVHGFIDTSYTFNMNTPVSPNASTNSLRIFDTESNSFMLNLVELNVEKAVSQESPLGFRVDLTYGDDAESFSSTGLGSATDEFDLWQVYAHMQLPFSMPFMHEMDIKIGKFATLLGAEVIESPSNWNFSRSYLFGYAIPFNHTGFRMHLRPFEEYDIDITCGVVNGWDSVNDNNKAKTLESQIAISPFEDFSFAVTGIFGPERDDSNKDFRSVIDLLATYTPTDRLTLMVNYDYGYERNAANVDKDASWDGIAGYVKYDLFDWWSIAGRGEFFHDRDGIRTGLLASDNVRDLKVWELTLTNEFRLYKNFVFRAEYRYDKADEKVFAKDKESASYQNTIAVEVIYEF